MECRWCAKNFNPTHGLQKYCSIQCGKKFNSRKAKASPLYKYCDFCGCEHMKISDNFYIYNKNPKKPNFHCKKKKVWQAGQRPSNPKVKKSWKKRNPDNVLASQNRQTENITDGYIRRRLFRMGGHAISKELIELKRTHIKLKRKIYGKANGNSQSISTGA